MRPLILLSLALGLAACEEGSPIDAQAWNATDQCWEAAEEVGTSSAEDCGEALTLGTGPDDTCYLFSNTCLPEDAVWAQGCVDVNATVDAGDCG